MRFQRGAMEVKISVVFLGLLQLIHKNKEKIIILQIKRKGKFQKEECNWSQKRTSKKAWTVERIANL